MVSELKMVILIEEIKLMSFQQDTLWMERVSIGFSKRKLELVDLETMP